MICLLYVINSMNSKSSFTTTLYMCYWLNKLIVFYIPYTIETIFTWLWTLLLKVLKQMLTLTWKLQVPSRTFFSSSCHWCGFEHSGTWGFFFRKLSLLFILFIVTWKIVRLLKHKQVFWILTLLPNARVNIGKINNSYEVWRITYN